MAKIEITNLYKDYVNNDGTILHAVKNASLTVNDGEGIMRFTASSGQIKISLMQ